LLFYYTRKLNKREKDLIKGTVLSIRPSLCVRGQQEKGKNVGEEE
jgi:hypothetical protein